MRFRHVHTVAAAAFVLAAHSAHAQDQTLFRGGASGIGFYVAPVVKLTENNGRSDVLGGARAGVIFGRRFGIGVAAYHSGDGHHGYHGEPGPMLEGGMPTIDGGFVPDIRDGNGLTYGGLELEYLWQPASLVHTSVSALFGGGRADRVGLIPQYYGGSRGGRDSFDRTFFVAEPTGSVEVNLVRHLRLALGVGYRFAAGGNDYANSVGPWSGRGVTGSLGLKLGKL